MQAFSGTQPVSLFSPEKRQSSSLWEVPYRYINLVFLPCNPANSTGIDKAWSLVACDGVWWPVVKPGTRGTHFLLSCRVWVWNIQGGSALGKCRSEEKGDRKQKPWVSKAMRQRESEWRGVSSNSWKNKQVERNRQRSWVMCLATNQEFLWGHQRVAYTTRPELLLSCCWVARTKI